MKLRLTPHALGDLHEIYDYIRERNPSGAKRVGDAIQASLRVIATYPHAGRSTGNGIRKFTLPRYPYLIFYGVDDVADEIQVFTIRHAPRDDES